MRVCKKPVIRSLAGTLGTLMVSVLPVLALEVGTGDGLMITLKGQLLLVAALRHRKRRTAEQGGEPQSCQPRLV